MPASLTNVKRAEKFHTFVDDSLANAFYRNICLDGCGSAARPGYFVSGLLCCARLDVRDQHVRSSVNEPPDDAETYALRA